MSVQPPQQQQPKEISEAEALDNVMRDSLEETISILEGVGPLCRDIDELIRMLELAIRNDSQLNLLRAHLAPKRLRR